MSKIKSAFKRKKKKVVMLIAMLAINIASEVCMYSSVVAYADSYSTLGTGSAIGSPILNKEFVTDDWNKWEMIVWGIYLSNFCMPLIDSYESAFSTGASFGTKGRGLQALEFGSGNDVENNETIKSLLTSAINYQSEVAGQTIYVCYTDVVDGIVQEKKNPASDGAVVREASFRDLFLAEKGVSGDNSSWADSVYGNSSVGSTTTVKIISEDYTIATLNTASLPTFYIKNGESYIEIMDYTDAWDIQMIAMLLNTSMNEEYEEEFFNNFEYMYGDGVDGTYSQTIKFDSFGNIVANKDGNNIIVVPASVNQHITSTKKINLLNSWVLNGTTSNINENISKNGRQATSLDDLFLVGDAFSDTTVHIGFEQYELGGVPAFSSSTTEGKLDKGTVVIYKDSDSIAYNLTEYSVPKLLLEIMKRGKMTGDTQIKVEAINVDNVAHTKSDSSPRGALYNTIGASYRLANMVSSSSTDINTTMILPSGKKVEMFTGEVMVSNQLRSAKSGEEKENFAITRALTSFMYEAYQQDIETAYGVIGRDKIESLLNNCDGKEGLNDVYSELYRYYVEINTSYKGVDYNPNGSFFIMEDAAELALRFTVVQIPSKELSSCANILGVKEGSEFALYSTMIYATYLNFYGINTTASLGISGGNQTELNTQLFKSSAAIGFDISEIQGMVSSEQKEKEVLNMSYLVLSNSESGTAYRDKLNQSSVAAFINTQYNKIVYGGSTSTSGSTGTGNTGFLSMATIEENPFTAPLVTLYGSIAVWVITTVIIVIILVGLLTKKNVLWYLISLLVAINVVLVLPSISNISSVVSNNIVQGIFKDKMTLWSISEQIEDKRIDEQNQEVYSDTTDSGTILKELTDSLSIVSSDRTLLVKNDISSKVTSALGEEYSSIQRLKSARWLMPILLQQISADEDNINNYVYKTMINTMDDATNMYLYYNDSYSGSIGTIASMSDAKGNLGESISANERASNYFLGYKNTNEDTVLNGVSYRHIGYYRTGCDDMSHTYFYLLKAKGSETTPLCISRDGLIDNKEVESYQNYIDTAVLYNKSVWETTTSHLEDIADEYNRVDRSTVDQSYGYLWNSESVYNYMYQTVEDSFDSTESLGSVIGKIQGQYKLTSDGDEERASFMHAEDMYGNTTGYTRDILDLQELFTNNIPYMYQMWLTAGGFDGESGILTDRVIANNDYYDGANASWLYRCNWAIKIMEDKDLNGSAVVYDAEGNRYTVENMLYPECYPSERPMIFSRAQQMACGVSDASLSYVELKCIELNEATEISWTSLLNYAGSSGLTKEILLRQMALEATFNFNKEFTTGMASAKTALYPTAVDLRNISFDSIMKMIVLNVTKDSSYIYGGTMEDLINRTDLLTAMILLATAFVCQYLIPLVRNIVQLTTFILGMFAIVMSPTSSNKFKIKVFTGAIVSQLVIIALNIAYYGAFALFIKSTNTDEILSVSAVKASVASGNPLWALLIVLAISIVYIVLMIMTAKLFIENRGDMGFSLYSDIITNACSKISESVENIGERISSIGDSNDTRISETITSIINSHRGYEDKYSGKSDNATKVEIVQEKGDVIDVNEVNTDSASNTDRFEYNESKYEYGEDSFVTDETDRINREIEKGSQK